VAGRRRERWYASPLTVNNASPTTDPSVSAGPVRGNAAGALGVLFELPWLFPALVDGAVLGLLASGVVAGALLFDEESGDEVFLLSDDGAGFEDCEVATRAGADVR
jgi:hypothetical protein